MVNDGSRFYQSIFHPRAIYNSTLNQSISFHPIGRLHFMRSPTTASIHKLIESHIFPRSQRFKGQLGVRIYFTPFQKQWNPQKEHDIRPCHINSGQTDFYDNGNRLITIWRREDFHKVLIHELLHAYNWDRLVPSDVRHNTKTHQHQGEAAVEAMAFLLHMEIMHLTPAQKRKEWAHMQKQSYIMWLSQATSTQTHALEYCLFKCALVKTALVGSSDSESEFRQWLALPTVKECQTQWKSLLKHSLARLVEEFEQQKQKERSAQSQSSPSPNAQSSSRSPLPLPSNMSMSLVLHQTSLE
jgi:hypothetical protein